MKIKNMFCFWSQVFFHLVKIEVEKWPTPGTKSGVFRYVYLQKTYYKPLYKDKIRLLDNNFKNLLNFKRLGMVDH